MGEPVAPTTVGELDQGLQVKILERGIQANAQFLVWDGFAEHREGSGDGTGVLFPLLSAISPATSELSASANPSPTQLADTSVTISPKERGVPVELQKKLSRMSKVNVIMDAIDTLATNMAETRDQVAGTAAVGGSVVRFAGGAANAAALGPTNVVTRAELVRGWTVLQAALAPKFADGTYYAGLSPYSIGDLMGSGGTAGDFIDVAKYAAPEAIRTGEIGKFMGFTVFSASQATFDNQSAGPSSLADRVFAVLAGRGFLGYAFDVEPYIQAAREAEDALMRFLIMGWYGCYDYGRIREANGYRIEARSAYAPDNVAE